MNHIQWCPITKDRFLSRQRHRLRKGDLMVTSVNCFHRDHDGFNQHIHITGLVIFQVLENHIRIGFTTQFGMLPRGLM